MTMEADPLLVAWWVKNLDEIDREIARLASMCQVRIFDDGVVERILRNDESVCETANPVAFKKLHNLVVMHFLVLKRSVEAVGPLQTSQIEQYVIERLKKSADGRPAQ